MENDTKLKDAITALLLLTGCKHEECDWSRSPEEGRRYHQDIIECLKASPQPTHNHEDDNGHIVEECRIAAAWSEPLHETCKEVIGAGI